MSEQQMTALVERVGESLHPDVARLVAGGAARGRSVRRRRRVAIGATALGVTAAACVVPLVSGGGDRTPTFASDPPTGVRALGVSADDMGEALAGLLPGSRVVDGDSFQFQVQQGTVAWRGTTVSVSIDVRSAGTATPARERCESFLDMPCTAGPDGSWIGEHGTIEMDTRTGVLETEVRQVRVYVPDGYVIEAAGEGGTPAGNRQLLRRLALADVWLA